MIERRFQPAHRCPIDGVTPRRPVFVRFLMCLGLFVTVAAVTPQSRSGIAKSPQQAADLDSSAFRSPPPLAKRPVSTGVDLVAFWYNDFGLKSTLANNNQFGWHGWYDWQWNRKDGRAIDPAREPLLGWFHGDDPMVLDWQCHWLASYGINAVALSPSDGISLADWQKPSNPYHWLYAYMTGAPNCRQLRYILFARAQFGGTPADHIAAWRKSFAVMDRYRNYYSLQRNGRSYPCLYVFEGEALRGVFDKYLGAEATARFLTNMASELQKKGKDGLCLLVRHGTAPSIMDRQALLKKGVVYLDAEYSMVSGESPDAQTMSQLTASLAIKDHEVANVVTARTSMAHPSKFSISGASPDAFRQQLGKAVSMVRSRPDLPQLVTIYSVWEWAEGGPNLSPSRADGFGYLEAVHDVVEHEKDRH